MSATPKNCPQCGREINTRRLPKPKQSKLAIILYVVGALACFVWIAIVFKWSPVLPRKGFFGGSMIKVLIYIWPGILFGIVAAMLPKVQVVRCTVCDWKTTIRKKSAKAS